MFETIKRAISVGCVWIVTLPVVAQGVVRADSVRAGSPTAVAPQPEGTITGSDDLSINIEKKDTTTYFNALEYSLQKRYRPTDADFRNEKFIDNTFVSVGGGVQKLYMRDYHRYKSGPELAITVGKNFTPLHTLRVGLHWDKYRFIELSHKTGVHDQLTHVGVEADYLFNLSAYTRGYNPNRKVEFSPLGGVGIYCSTFDGDMKNAVGIHGGFQLRYRPVTGVAFFLEPRIDLYSPGIDHSATSNWHKYNMGFGAMAGIQYYIRPSGGVDSREYLYEKNGWRDHLFVQLMAGGALPLSVADLGLNDALGLQYGIAVGKWFMPALGVRASAFMASCKWGHDYLDPSLIYKDDYLGGRVEAMVGLLPLFKPSMKGFFLELNALVGVEFGRLKKELDMGQGVLKQGYAGFTGGLQVKARFLKHFGVFLEPRLSQIPYSITRTEDNEIGEFDVDYLDRRFSLNLGIQVDLDW